MQRRGPLTMREAIGAETMILPVQVNGRVRGRIEVAHDTPEAEIKRQALQLTSSAIVTRHSEGSPDDLRTRTPGEHCYSLTWRKPGKKFSGRSCSTRERRY